jgi:hypothetical protein
MTPKGTSSLHEHSTDAFNPFAFPAYAFRIGDCAALR